MYAMSQTNEKSHVDPWLDEEEQETVPEANEAH